MRVGAERKWIFELPNVPLIQYENNRWIEGLWDITVNGNGTILQSVYNTTNRPFIGNYNVFGPREGIFRVRGNTLLGGPEPLAIDTGERFDGGNVGDNSITLTSTTAAAMNLVSGSRVVLMGYCLQAVGYSPNMRHFEWLEVDSVSGSTVTFKSRLTDFYSDLWTDHLYLAGTHIGKPRIINLDHRPQDDGFPYVYPKNVHLKNFTVKQTTFGSQDSLSHSAERLTFEGLDLTDNVHLFGRESRHINVVDCDLGFVEIDKIIGTYSIEDSRLGMASNIYSLNSGTSAKHVIVKRTMMRSSCNVTAIDGLTIENSEMSATSFPNTPLQGALTMGFISKYAGGSANFAGNKYITLSEQDAIPERSMYSPYEPDDDSAQMIIHDIDVANNSLLFDYSFLSPSTTFTDPAPMMRFFCEGRPFWLRDKPLARGIMSSIEDEGNVIRVRFSSGNIVQSATVGDYLETTTMRSVIFEGEQWLDFKNDTGVDWENLDYDFSVWSLDGSNITANGSNTAAHSTLTLQQVKANTKYEMLVNFNRISGNLFIRGEGSGANIALLNAASAQGVDMILPIETHDLGGNRVGDLNLFSNLSAPFNGSIDIKKIYEV